MKKKLELTKTPSLTKLYSGTSEPLSQLALNLGPVELSFSKESSQVRLIPYPWKLSLGKTPVKTVKQESPYPC